jgi:dsRNA-specific ribonuclease
MAQVAAAAAAGDAAGQIGSTIFTKVFDKLFPNPQEVALSKAQAAQVIQETANDKARVDIEDRAQKGM